MLITLLGTFLPFDWSAGYLARSIAITLLERFKLAESWASSDATRRSMVGNRGRDTRPELMIRQLLFRQGARYRVDYAPLSDKRRRADIVFPGQRIACFLDGCFWHGCPDHYVAPKKNAEFWNDKVKTNMKRDIDTTARLEEAGWKVLRFWEHENPSDVADEILKAIGRGRQSTAASSQESSA